MASEAVRDSDCGGGVEEPVVDDDDDEDGDLECGDRGSVHREEDEELECKAVSSK